MTVAAAWLDVGDTGALVKRRAFVPLLALLLTAACTYRADAQDAPHRVWAAVGIGGGDAYGGGGGAGPLLQLVYERAPHHFALRGIALTDLPGTSNEGLGEVGLMYGRFGGGGMGFAAASAGLSAVYMDMCGSSQRNCLTVGVPLVVEVAFTPLGVLGIGLQAFANLNPKATYAGAFVMIPIGWMP